MRHTFFVSLCLLVILTIKQVFLPFWGFFMEIKIIIPRMQFSMSFHVLSPMPR